MAIKLLYLNHFTLYKCRPNDLQVLLMCNAFQKMGITTYVTIPIEKGVEIKNIEKRIEANIGSKMLFKSIYYPYISFLKYGDGLGTLISIMKYFNIKNDFDFIFTRSLFINFIAVRKYNNVIFESHGAKLHVRSELLNILYSKILLCSTKLSSQILFVTISEELKKYWLSRGVNSKKVISAHDAVDINKYNANVSILEARQALEINTSKKIAMYIGSLFYNRGIDKIFKLAQVFKNVMFYIVGGPEENILYYKKLLARENIDNVIIVGLIRHNLVNLFLSAADVLLLLFTWKVPTIKYASPLKLFEYMAAKKIIVAQRFPTITEILSNKESLLADPNSFNDLVEKLNEAFEMSYPNDISEAPYRKGAKYYTWDKRASQIINNVMKRLA